MSNNIYYDSIYEPSRKLTTDEIAEGDEIFFNYFNNLFENNEITINWLKNKEIKYTIKNLLKISILDRNYDINNLVDNTFPYLEFIWYEFSTFKILIYIDTNNQDNMNYIKQYKLLYRTEKKYNIINLIKNIIKFNYFWFSISLNDNNKYSLYLDTKNIYKIILCYYLTILKPLFLPSYIYSSSLSDISQILLSKENMNELLISSKLFSFNIKYNLITRALFELQNAKSQDEFLLLLKKHIEQKYVYDFYNIDISYIKNDERKNINLNYNVIHNISGYNSLLWMINKIFIEINS